MMLELVLDMSLDRLQSVVETLPEQVRRALDGAAAQALNSRPQTIHKRPLEMRVKALRSSLQRRRDEDLAGEILRTYLLGPRKDLVVAFLDATGVPHEDGQITDDEAGPDAEKIGPAVDALVEEHDRDDVLLYLEIAAFQWPEVDAVGEARDRMRAAAGS